MRAIRKMQRVIAALFILVLLAFCGLRIYRRLTVDVTPPVITCSSGSIDVSVTAGDEALLQGGHGLRRPGRGPDGPDPHQGRVPLPDRQQRPGHLHRF